MDSSFSRPEYKYGFVTPVETEVFFQGLNEGTIRALSEKKKEPSFILDFRLKAFRFWEKSHPPQWANLSPHPIDFQKIAYYAELKSKPKRKDLEELDPEILETLSRLGISLEEQKRLANVAVDVVFDSVSIGTTFQEKLKKVGVILCSMSEAIELYPELIQEYLGMVVPPNDNYYAALNGAVFSDGSFVYIPKGVQCPMELSTYFRINEKEVGQFERTLIIAEEGSSVSYLEGCTAPAFDSRQLHAAVVELVALDHAQIRYSTVQNWYAGDPDTGEGGVYNFVTKRGLCKGTEAKISWTQVEAGAAMTWKYPSCILSGEGSVGEFFSIALTSGKMEADTGTKMVHLGKNTRSTILSKSIAADESRNTYRSLVKVASNATGARNFSQCESMLVGKKSSVHTFPLLQAHQGKAKLEHEASTCRMSEEQIFYLQSRGLAREDAIQMVVNGFCKEVIQKLPLEFAAESQKLLMLKLEGSIG